ncbi:hypothetical protein Tco_0871747 [Tanacetum coccineum]
MDAPPSPNHILDFPANESALELEDLDMEVEEDPGEDPEEDSDMDIDKDEKDEWEEDDDWLMAPNTPLRAASFQLSTYEVRGLSLAVPEAPCPAGRPLPVVVARVALHHEEIGALCVRADKMEYMKTSLVRKGKLVAGKLDETETQVLEMRVIVNNYPRGQVDLLREKDNGLNGWTETMN